MLGQPKCANKSSCLANKVLAGFREELHLVFRPHTQFDPVQFSFCLGSEVNES